MTWLQATAYDHRRVCGSRSILHDEECGSMYVANRYLVNCAWTRQQRRGLGRRHNLGNADKLCQEQVHKPVKVSCQPRPAGDLGAQRRLGYGYLKCDLSNAPMVVVWELRFLVQAKAVMPASYRSAVPACRVVDHGRLHQTYRGGSVCRAPPPPVKVNNQIAPPHLAHETSCPSCACPREGAASTSILKRE